MVFELDRFVQKYDVHPETVAFLEARQADGAKPYYEMGVAAAREASIEASVKYGGTTIFEGEEREIAIPSPYCKDGIPVTIYHPRACEDNPAPTLLVYFHGGGNTLGCRQTHATVCKILARDTPCIVLNVEYRLAPEHPLPANNDDAKCVVEWVSANKMAVGGSAKSKLGVAGDSAGGRISAVVCHEACALIDFAVLVYPNVDSSFSFPSVKEFEDGPGLSKSIIDWFVSLFLPNGNTSDVRASPILNEDFTKLPPTLLVVAELDPLRDGCYAAFPESCKEAHSKATEFIREQTVGV